jgi:uncharacterized protein YuzE
MPSNLRYFDTDDVIHIQVADGPEANSVEISPNITVELDESGEIIGIEILNATEYLRDNILETVQGKLLRT